MTVVAPALDVAAIARKYFAAWEANDPDAIIEMHAPDTEFWLHMGSEPVRGRSEVRDNFAAMFVQFPDFRFETYRTFYGERHWVLDWALLSTLPGDSPKPVRFDCLDIVTLHPSGLIHRKDTFVDMMQFNAALGS